MFLPAPWAAPKIVHGADRLDIKITHAIRAIYFNPRRPYDPVYHRPNSSGVMPVPTTARARRTGSMSRS